jgi:hypothetical protein
MGRYRKIDPRIHNDAKYNALSERGKLFFLSILTHPHMTALGAMRATEAGLCEEMTLGASKKDAGCLADCAAGCASDCQAGRPAGVFENYRRAFRNLIEQSLIKFDPANACLVIPNFLKYNPPESPSVVMAWNQAGDLIPECQLKDDLIENTRLFLNGYGKPSFLEAFKLVPNGGQAAPQTDGQTDGQPGLQAGGQSAGQQEQEQEYNKPPTPLPGGGGTAPPTEGKKPKRQTKRQKALANPYSPDFERFYKAYPNKKGGKDEAWRLWQERAEVGKLPSIDHMMAYIEALIPRWAQDSNKFAPMITTFIKQGRWTDADALISKEDDPQNKIDPNCPHCHGSGLVAAVDGDGDPGMATCRCRGEKHD